MQLVREHTNDWANGPAARCRARMARRADTEDRLADDGARRLAPPEESVAGGGADESAEPHGACPAAAARKGIPQQC